MASFFSRFGNPRLGPLLRRQRPPRTAFRRITLLFSLLLFVSCREGLNLEGQPAIAGSEGEERSQEQKLPWVEARLGLHPLRLMIAQSDREQMRGLMFRRFLAPDEGMLFVYDKPQLMHFWMKNTLLSLDLIFFSPERRVTEFILGMEPDPGLSDAELPSYSSREEAQYALEVASGSVVKWGIRPGDELFISLPQAKTESD